MPILLCLVILNIDVAAQQTPFLQWQHSYGGSGLDKIRSIKQTNDGGYIVAGHSFSNDGNVKNNHGNNDYWILKLNSAGNVEWKKTYGGSDYDYAISVQQTADNGCIVAGYTNSNDGDVTGNHGGYDYWIIKLDETGKLKWQKTYGGTKDDFANSIQQTFDGGYIVAGSTASGDGDVTNNNGKDDYWVLKLDAAGNLEWQKTFGSTNDDQAYSIQQTSDSNYIVAGYTDVTGRSYDYYIIKLDTIGNLKWQKRYGGSAAEVAYSIQETKNGGYAVGGYSLSNDGDVKGNHGNYDFWVLKLTAGGMLKWQKSLGGSGNDYGYSIEQTTDGNYVVTGSSTSNDGNVSFNHGGSDYWVVKIDDKGKMIWQKSLGGSLDDYPYFGYQTSDGGYIAAGYSYSNDGNVTINRGDEDYWIAKLSPDVLNENIKVKSYNVANDCSSANSISFKITNDTTSYKVNLYRFGLLYDSALNITSHTDFDKLPCGAYYATAASGNIIYTSNTVSLLPKPGNINVTNITSSEAQLNWTGFVCTDSYTIQYRIQGSKRWKTKDTTAVGFTLKNLMPAATYVCRISSHKSKNGIIATSKFSDSVVFTTASAFAVTNQNNITIDNKNRIILLNVSPNPAKNYFVINFKDVSQQKINAVLYDVNGKALWSSGLINANALNGKHVNTSQFAKGIFYLKLMNENGASIGATKIVIAK